MKKTFLFLAALAMSAMTWAETASIELCTSWSKTLAYDKEYTQDYTIGDLNGGTTTMTLAVKGVYRQGATNTYFQMNKKDGYFKNTTKLPGKITKIETIWSVAKGATKCYFATDAEATSSDTVVVTAGESVTYIPNDENEYYFFNIDVKTGSGSAQLKNCVVYYETGTPTPQKEIVSLEIGGTATKMEYFVGEAFNPAGLTVTATYGDASSEDVASKATWTIEPATFTEASESASVTVKAKVGEVESEPKTITGIVVKAKPAAKYVPVAWNEIENGGKYFITAANEKEYYFAAKTFAAKTAPAIEFDASSAPEADMWVFTKNGNTWKISTADGAGLYMNNDNNGLVCAADTGANFTVAQGSSAEFTDLTASDGTNTRYIALYEKNNFRCYKTTSSSGIRDLKLYGLKKEGVVTKPSFTPSEGEFDGSVEVTLTADEGADIYFTIDGTTPEVGKSTSYEGPFTLTATTTIKAIAEKSGKTSEVAEKTYTKIPVFESLEALVTNLPATETSVTVIVTITEAKIDSFYVTSQKQTNGVYVTAASTAVELYEYNVPGTWKVGGTLSATTLKAQWLLYKGTAELQKWDNGWTKFNYTAPSDPTNLNNVNASKKATKTIVNGQIVIVRDGKAYNVLGF